MSSRRRSRAEEQQSGSRRSRRQRIEENRIVEATVSSSSASNIIDHARNQIQRPPGHPSNRSLSERFENFAASNAEPWENFTSPRAVQGDLSGNLVSQHRNLIIIDDEVSSPSNQSNQDGNLFSQQSNVIILDEENSSPSNQRSSAEAAGFTSPRALQRDRIGNLVYQQRNPIVIDEQTPSPSTQNPNPSAQTQNFTSPEPLQNDRNGDPVSRQTNSMVVDDSSSLTQRSSPARTRGFPNGKRISQPRNVPRENSSDKKSKQQHYLQQLLKALETEFSCSVCLDICYEPCTSSCAHSFCRLCLDSTIRKCGNRCPVCRKHLIFDPDGLLVNKAMWNVIKLFFSDEVEERKKTIAAEEQFSLRNQTLQEDYTRNQRQEQLELDAALARSLQEQEFDGSESTVQPPFRGAFVHGTRRRNPDSSAYQDGFNGSPQN